MKNDLISKLLSESKSSPDAQVPQITARMSDDDKSRFSNSHAAATEDARLLINKHRRKHTEGTRTNAHSKTMQVSTNSGLVDKLRSELDAAISIIASRDSEIKNLRKNAKIDAFQRCNIERLSYLNEVIKLQKLIKIYLGGNNQKVFKGVMVTQNASKERLKK